MVRTASDNRSKLLHNLSAALIALWRFKNMCRVPRMTNAHSLRPCKRFFFGFTIFSISAFPSHLNTFAEWLCVYSSFVVQTASKFHSRWSRERGKTTDFYQNLCLTRTQHFGSRTTNFSIRFFTTHFLCHTSFRPRRKIYLWDVFRVSRN